MKKGSGVTQKEIRAELEDMKPSAESLAFKRQPKRANLPKEESRAEKTITVQWYTTGTCAYCGHRDANKKTLAVSNDPACNKRSEPKPEDYKFICASCELDAVPKPKARRKDVTNKKRGMHVEEEDED